MDAITTPAPASEAPGDEHILLIPEDVAVYFEAADTNELTWPFAWWFYGVQLMLRVTLSPDGFTVERDENAALNILRLGLQAMGTQSLEAHAL